MKLITKASSLLLLGVALLAGGARADGRNPGSLLIFPEYDHGPGRNTLITVTNSSPDAPITVHFNYVSGLPGAMCEISNRLEVLTPNDTITVLSSAHSGQPPTGNKYKGYVYVYAERLGVPISFNFLIGDEIVLDANLATLYAMNPVVFKAKPPTSQPTNLDGDSVRDLNDLEYEGVPEQILIPRFIGQTATRQSDLILISLTGGASFTTIVNFVIFNDNEEVFSAQHAFTCWKKTPLSSISALFANDFLHNQTTDAVAEIIGSTQDETGWMIIDGAVANSSARSFQDPAILAVLVEKAGNAPNNLGAEIPFFTGKQFNGDLVPTGVFGDDN